MDIRPHPITGDPIIHAPERALRPHAFVREPVLARALFDPGCPFCPGNEAETPPELARDGDPWRVRVVPNKYPFAARHEVIIESPDHSADFPSITHASAVVALQLERLRLLKGDPRIRHTALFKNHGSLAGSSLAHPHSQIAAITFVPPRISREGAAFRRAQVCPLCQLLANRVKDGERGEFALLAPPAAAFAGTLWIVPRAHQNVLEASAAGIDDLAALLQSAIHRTGRTADAYNWMLLEFADERGAHAYVEVIPRTSSIAGFELATGTFIDGGDGTR